MQATGGDPLLGDTGGSSNSNTGPAQGYGLNSSIVIKKFSEMSTSSIGSNADDGNPCAVLHTLWFDSIARFYLVTVLWFGWTGLTGVTFAMNPMRCNMTCSFFHRGLLIRAWLGGLMQCFWCCVVLLLYTLHQMADAGRPRSSLFLNLRRLLALVVASIPFTVLYVLLFMGSTPASVQESALIGMSAYGICLGVVAGGLACYVPPVLEEFTTPEASRKVRWSAIFLCAIALARGIGEFPFAGVDRPFYSNIIVALIGPSMADFILIFGAIVILRTNRAVTL